MRETLVEIAPFAFILGVEPPRKGVESQIRNYWVKNVAKVFHLFEAATEEIRRRLKNSDLPRLKVAFKRETITN